MEGISHIMCIYYIHEKSEYTLEHNVFIYCHITSRPGIARVTHYMATINLSKSGEKNISPLAIRKKRSKNPERILIFVARNQNTINKIIIN